MLSSCATVCSKASTVLASNVTKEGAERGKKKRERTAMKAFCRKNAGGLEVLIHGYSTNRCLITKITRKIPGKKFAPRKGWLFFDRPLDGQVILVGIGSFDARLVIFCARPVAIKPEGCFPSGRFEHLRSNDRVL